SNVLVSRTGAVKLADFGVVRLENSQTSAKVVRGKWEFFPPELVKGEVGPRGDLFALAIVLYQLATLHHPFEADTPQGHFDGARTSPARSHPDLPEGLWQALGPALSASPDARPSSPEAFAQSLEAYLFSARAPVGPQQLGRKFAQLLPPALP